MTTIRLRSSPPNTPKAALRRDQRLAQQLTPLIRDQFDRERRRVLRDPTAPDLRTDEWETVLGELWAAVGGVVLPSTFAHLTDATPDQRATAPWLTAIIALLKGRQEAKEIEDYLAAAAAGIVATTEKRIARTAASPAGKRNLNRAIARLYRVDFMRKRAPRIALDTVLRASATFEHHAVRLAAKLPGLDFERHWLTQGDDKVRESHRNVTSVKAGELFDVGGGMRFPKDPRGPSRETYGCRCWAESRRVKS
jgi:hypothetical protein